MPRLTVHSTHVGEYSTIRPHGSGTKPGTIVPMPFSISIATISAAQHT
jgi:hypothetical protein